MLKGHFSLAYFKQYCSFLLEEHLEEFATKDLQRNKDIQLPLLKLFAHLSKEELLALSIKSVKEYLQRIIEDKAVDGVVQSMANWKADKIEGIPRDQVQASDIVLVYNARKYTLLNFLPRYTRDPEHMIRIINEIEDFYTFQERLAMDTFAEIKQEEVSILQEELQASNEELRETNLTLEERVEQRTEELLKQREYLYSVLMQAPAAIAILKGPELVYELATPMYYKVVGKTELVGLPGRKALSELNDQGIWSILENVFHTGETFYGTEVKILLDRKNDSSTLEECYFNFVSTPLRRPDGSIEGIMIHAVEVTQQVLATIQARESADQFKLMLESIPPMAWTTHADGAINYYSKRWYDYTGLTEEESINQGWEKIIHPDDVHSTWETWKQRLASGAPLEMENRFKRASDGQYRWHLVTGVPIRDQHGKIKLWVGTCTDIHDYKTATRIIRENEAQLKLITNNIPAYISYIDKEGTYLFTNEYYNKLNFAEGPLKGRKLIDVQGPEAYERLKPYFNKVLNAELVTFETTALLKDGSLKKLEVKLAPDQDTEGQIKGFVVMAIDLTERIEIEKTLEEKNKDLLRINSDLDNFIYTASHDLKSPIANIEGLIHTLFDVMQENGYNDEETTILIDMLKYSIRRFQTTLNDLTQVGKAQKNFNEDIQEINVAEIVEEIQHSIENQIIDSKAIIKTDIDSNINMRFSRINFKSIVYNLLTNSIKYQSSERRPFIEVAFFPLEKYFVLEVKDNGMGMKKEHTGKIFGMFSRLHDHVEGSGVGLYLVKRIVENSEGKIEVESKEGEGSIFKIYLPKNEQVSYIQ